MLEQKPITLILMILMKPMILMKNMQDSFDEKYTKTKFNSDDDLPLKNAKLHNMIINTI